jgi:hypothetical protein
MSLLQHAKTGFYILNLVDYQDTVSSFLVDMGLFCSGRGPLHHVIRHIPKQDTPPRQACQTQTPPSAIVTTSLQISAHIPMNLQSSATYSNRDAVFPRIFLLKSHP